jgi:hypothetical protein
MNAIGMIELLMQNLKKGVDTTIKNGNLGPILV